MTKKKLIGWEYCAVRRSGAIRKYKVLREGPAARRYRYALRAWIERQPTRYRLHAEPIYA
jgi:hypothetical protein